MNTQFIIKPDAYRRRDELIGFIQNRGYSVFRVQDFKMIPEIFNSLYKGLIPETIISGVFEYLTEDFCVKVESDISINNLMGLSGTNTDPFFCSKGTIRREFGAGKGVSKLGVRVIRNAIHRPKTINQNKREIILLEELL
ncbi:nucleoside-diphosphate kinase [Candidatus Woesearchaeota archaeon]|nr:nucleoside-diphosphate kinase [Candidatus Woesearchaeota archaeon]